MSKAKSRKSLDAFKVWLVERGAILDALTNPYEILRARTCEGVFVVYRNDRGTETWPDGLVDIRTAFEEGRNVPLSPSLKARVRLRHLIDTLATRDGLECWFCGNGFLSADSREVTIEHLVAVGHGGPNHPSNLVLACSDCNSEVGIRPVAEKVLIREMKRGRTAA